MSAVREFERNIAFFAYVTVLAATFQTAWVF